MNPEYCPCDREKLEEGVTCNCLGYSPYVKGSGSLCIGTTQLHEFKCHGYEHVNGYVFCIRFGVKDGDAKIQSHRTCKKDLEILHDMLHKAVGFMHHEVDEDSGWWEPNEEVQNG